MTLRTVEEQLAVVLAAVRALPGRTIPVTDLAAATGAVLREPVRAIVPIPVFDNSAMDGFAVRFEDVAGAAPERPVTLRVVADLPAGTSEDPPLRPGEAARIMTGAPAPSAADTVVPFEDTAEGIDGALGPTRVLRAPQRRGAHIRRAGEDLCAGDVVLPAGIVLGALQLSAAAAAGVAEIVVSERPRVAVVSTGTELVPPGGALRHGQIPESNSILLSGLVATAGGVVVERVSVDDSGEGLREVLARIGGQVDVIVFSGGVSAGAYEVVRTELAGAMTFTRVAMQPGKPQGFGVLPHGPIAFGLPGNPVSAAVSFEVFVRPALLALQGRDRLQRPTLRLPAATGWRTPPGRRQYLPAVIDTGDPAGWRVRPATAGGSGSHLVGGLGAAVAYAIVPAETEAVAAGDHVEVMLLEGSHANIDPAATPAVVS